MERIQRIRLELLRPALRSSRRGEIVPFGSKNIYHTSSPSGSALGEGKGRENVTVITGSATHLSPRENPSTFFPIAEITPTTSCPGISYIYVRWEHVNNCASVSELTGNFARNSPSWTCPSVPHTPSGESIERQEISGSG